MDSSKISLLPYVIDLLSHQPDLCSSMNSLCDQVKHVVMDEIINPFTSITDAVKFAVELGVNLGLLSMIENRIRVHKFAPNKCKKKSKKVKPTKSKKKAKLPKDCKWIKRLARKVKYGAIATKKRKTICATKPKTKKSVEKLKGISTRSKSIKKCCCRQKRSTNKCGRA